MNREGFYRLFSGALDKRYYLFGITDTDCFRLFNAAGDGFEGLTIDYYSGFILVQYFASTARDNLDDIVYSAVKVFEKIPRGICGVLVKNRMNTGLKDINEARKSIVVEGDYPEEGIVVLQNGIKAAVDLIHGQSTGVFLDMREIRGKLPDYYAEFNVRSMLNLFSYTALFSVHALMNGLSASVNVDLSKSVLKKGRENYLLNGLVPDDRDFIYGDAMEWVRYFFKKGKTFDFAVFDPPTFARNRKSQFSVKNDYMSSLDKLDVIVKKQGMILTSINSYSVTEEEYFSYHPGSWQLLMFNNESSDFVNRGNPYLKVGLWQK